MNIVSADLRLVVKLLEIFEFNEKASTQLGFVSKKSLIMAVELFLQRKILAKGKFIVKRRLYQSEASLESDKKFLKQ